MTKILAIEDSQALRRLYETVLRRFGYELVLAESGEAGIEAARRIQPDLIILDMLLPDIHGTRVAQRLREEGILAVAPLIITSGVSKEDTEAVAGSLGAAAWVSKPFDIGTMLETLQNALAPSSQEVSGI